MTETLTEPLAIEVSGLTKIYSGTHAVSNIEFSAHQGEILGFIGPNGAGKTTTIRILAGLLLPTSGTAKIAGISVTDRPRETRRIVGYMPDFVGYYDNTTVREFLDFFASAYRVPKEKRPGVVQDVLELTDLTGKADADMQHLSRGMGQRAALARCLLHDPKVLLLDEPASGLDPRGRIEMRALLKELSRMGKTILISSHILTELSDLCTRVAIIEAGEIVVSGTPREVSQNLVRSTPEDQQTEGTTFRLTLVSQVEDALLALQEIPSVQDAQIIGERSIEGIYRGSEEEASEVVTRMVNKGFRVMSFVEKQLNLEDVFLRVTKGDLQ